VGACSSSRLPAKSFLTSLPSALGLLVSDYLFKLISRLTSQGQSGDAEEEKSRAHMPPIRAPNLRIYWFKNGSNSWCCSALLRTYLFLSLAVRKTEIKTRRVIWNYCGAHFSSFFPLVTSFALALQWWRPSGLLCPGILVAWLGYSPIDISVTAGSFLFLFFPPAPTTNMTRKTIQVFVGR
jgi:hypothetical protein